MATIITHEESIFHYYQELIKFNKEQRSNQSCPKLRAAMNLNIILCSACLVEGVLEDRGKLLIGYHREVFNTVHSPEFEIRKPLNVYYNNLEEFLCKRISQTTGVENYNSLFEILTGESFKQHDKVKPFVEGVNVLFQLRNVIAHGRKVHSFDFKAYYTDGFEENFFGGYKKAEDFLMKKGLISKKFKDAESSDIYFTNEISDFFSSLAEDFIEAIDVFVSDNIIIGDTVLENLNKYNENYNTNYDLYAYLRMRGCR